MVLNEYVEIKITPNNYKYYKEKGYEVVMNHPIKAKIEDISENCHVEVDCLCDNCREFYTKTYRYNERVKKIYGKHLCAECLKKEKTKKYKNTMQEKYGRETSLQSPVLRNKITKTNLEKYGVEFPMQNKEIKAKSDATYLEHYGTNKLMGNAIIKEKIHNTVKTTYGVDNVFQDERVKEKIKASCLEKYGVENISQSNECQEKIKKTCLEKYGVSNYSKTDEFKEKTQNTCKLHYGVEHPLQNKDLLQKMLQTYDKNGTVKTSKPQLQLYKLCKEIFPNLVVKINEPQLYYFLDIEITNENGKKIDIEYDGAYWHQNEKRDAIRDNNLMKVGYKILRIYSETNKLPTTQQLIDGVNLLLNSEENFCKISLLKQHNEQDKQTNE